MIRITVISNRKLGFVAGRGGLEKSVCPDEPQNRLTNLATSSPKILPTPAKSLQSNPRSCAKIPLTHNFLLYIFNSPQRESLSMRQRQRKIVIRRWEYGGVAMREAVDEGAD
jgi:hypothetical protein